MYWRIPLSLLVLVLGVFASSASAAGLKADAHRPVDGFASNLGRTILQAADLVALGTVGKDVEQRGGVFFRTFVLSKAYWGESEVAAVKLVYQNPHFLDAVGNRVALALVRVAKSDVYEPLGSPIDERDDGAIKAVRALIELDSTRQSIHERAGILKETLFAHLKEGGSAARFASIELIYLVNLQPQAFDRRDFLFVMKQLKDADKNTRADLKLAMKHLVSRVLKPEAQVALRMANGNAKEEERWIGAIDVYFKSFPGAFSRRDVMRMEMIASGLGEKSATRMLFLQSKIDQRISEREEALRLYLESRPKGLAGTGNAGSIDDREWRNRPTLFRAGLRQSKPKGSDE